MAHLQKTHADRLFDMGTFGKDVQLLRNENRAASCQVCATRRFFVASDLLEKVSRSKPMDGHRGLQTKHCAQRVGAKRRRTLVLDVPAMAVRVEQVAPRVPLAEWRDELHPE